MVNWGSLPSWLTIAFLVGAAWHYSRAGGGTAISSLESVNRVLDRQVHELKAKLEQAEHTIAELRGRTDVAEVLVPFAEELTNQMKSHEKRAQERFELGQTMAKQRSDQTVNLLGMIADRMPHEHNGDEGV